MTTSVEPVVELRLVSDEDDDGTLLVPETTEGAEVAFETVMLNSSHSDIDAAARPEHAAVAAPHRGG